MGFVHIRQPCASLKDVPRRLMGNERVTGRPEFDSVIDVVSRMRAAVNDAARDTSIIEPVRPLP